MRQSYIKKYCLFILALVVFVLSSSTDSYNRSIKWKKYKNRDYKFLAHFPATPLVQEDVDGDGTTLAVQHLNEQTGDVYFVSVFDAHEKLVASGLTTLAIETFTEKMDGALFMTKEIPHGQEATISLEEDQFIIYQVLVVQNRMYQIIATSNSPYGCNKSSKYLDSFELIN
jgi:hypothetical protein